MQVMRQHNKGYTSVTSYHLVGGDEGVFMVWREGKIVHLAAGDDGHWWEIGSYHEYWIPGIVEALEKEVPRGTHPTT